MCTLNLLLSDFSSTSFILIVYELKLGEHFADGGMGALLSVIAPAVGSEVISIGGAPNMRENAYLSEGARGDSTKRNVTSGTAMPSLCELVECNSCMTAQDETLGADPTISHEIPENIEVKEEVSGADPTISHEIPENIEVKEEVTGADPCSHEINEMHIREYVKEKESSKDVTADLISHEIIAETSAFASSSTFHEG